MDNEKSKATGHSGGATKVEPSTSSKNVPGNGRINVQMLQNVLLIWLDSNIDDNSTDCQNTISQLRRTVNTINTFTDGEQCIHFLQNMHNEKACMIISGELGQHIVPRVHIISQVDSIFIFCGNKKHYEQWANDWPKIKGVFTEVKPICEALKQAAQQCEQNAISITVMGNDGDFSKKNMDQLEPTFMYSQIMKEILLAINFEQQHFQEFITYCRAALANNERQLTYVENLQETYRDHTPIWWYTLESFLYPMLNRALRLMDTDVIIRLGFFIGDLHRQIEQLHNEQFAGSKSKKSFPVYRGQGIDKAQFENMAANKGCLLSFNCFLSTSKDRAVSLAFAESAAMNPDLIGVFFVMTIDPIQSTTPFASIVDVGYFGDREDEVLFSMHTVFRIGAITPIDEHHRLFRVELTLTYDNDQEFRQLTDRIREETYPHAMGWCRLGLVLLAMGQPDKAQRIYELLLEQESEEKAKGSIYNQLGWIKDDLGEYEEAIEFYEKSFAIQQQSLPPNHPDLAMSYNNIGGVYLNMGDYPKALSSFEKALAIRQQSLPSNHSHLATSYSSIGSVYLSMSDYPKALSSFEKALAIEQQSLPPNHPHLASSYNNIGEVYRNMGDYPKALSSYEKSLAINQQSLPSNHPHLASSHYNMGLLYENIGNYAKACLSYERAVEIGQKSLLSNHPELQKYRKKLADIKKKL